jgi:hypothetical protein
MKTEELSRVGAEITANDNNHKQEPSTKLERLIAIYKAEIGSGWETIFAQTVKIDINYVDLSL